MNHIIVTSLLSGSPMCSEPGFGASELVVVLILKNFGLGGHAPHLRPNAIGACELCSALHSYLYQPRFQPSCKMLAASRPQPLHLAVDCAGEEKLGYATRDYLEDFWICSCTLKSSPTSR